MRSRLIGTVFGLLLAACGRVERMDALYAQRCLNCHGPLGRGDGALAVALPAPTPDFRQTVEQRTNFQMRKVIEQGRGTMPAFSPALAPAEISDMVQMVRLLSREGRDISWWERFDTLVAAHCSIPWEIVFGTDEPEGVSR